MPPARHLLVWRKLAAAKWEDAWHERLIAVAGPRLTISTRPGRRFIRLEVWGLSRRTATALVHQYGGTVARISLARALAPGLEPRPPLNIRGRLLIVGTRAEQRRLRHRHPSLPILIVPPGLAFGTGAHATTASCLRLLADTATALATNRTRAHHHRPNHPHPPELLDLGTGTGILAMAARALGLTRVTAIDHDPAAVAAATAAVATNHLDGIRVQRRDLRRWCPRRPVAIITANLYAGLLGASATKIAAALRPGGQLIASGILRTEEPECLAALAAAGLHPDQIVRRGKWIALRARQSAETSAVECADLSALSPTAEGRAGKVGSSAFTRSFATRHRTPCHPLAVGAISVSCRSESPCLHPPDPPSSRPS